MNIYSYHHLSKKISRSSAEVLAQLLYWLSKQDSRLGHVEEGRQWIRNSYRQWQEQLGKLSISTIRRAFADLEQQGIVLTNHFEKGKKYRGGEQVKYFSVNFEKLHHIIEPAQMSTPTLCKMSTNRLQNEQPFTDNLSFTTNQHTVCANENHNPDFHTVCQSMFNLWNEIVLPKLQLRNLAREEKLTERRKIFLYKALTQCFEGDMNQWKSFCEKIAGNDFLTGGGERQFTASLDWVIKFEIIEKIREGKYDYDEAKQKKALEMKKGQAAAPAKLLPIVMPDGISFEEKNLRESLVDQLGEALYVSWIQNAIIQFPREEGGKPTLIAEDEFKASRIESCPQLRKITPLFDKIEWKKKSPLENMDVLKGQALDQETKNNLTEMAYANKLGVQEVLETIKEDVQQDLLIAGKEVDQALQEALLRKRARIAKRIGYLNYKGWFARARILETTQGDMIEIGSNFEKEMMCQRFESVMEWFIDITVVTAQSMRQLPCEQQEPALINDLACVVPICQDSCHIK